MTRNGTSKLSEANVRYIRAHYVFNSNAGELAKLFSINRSTVRGIATGQTWGWLDD